jgi:hypothetical protein
MPCNRLAFNAFTGSHCMMFGRLYLWIGILALFSGCPGTALPEPSSRPLPADAPPIDPPGSAVDPTTDTTMLGPLAPTKTPVTGQGGVPGGPGVAGSSGKVGTTRAPGPFTLFDLTDDELTAFVHV